MANFDDKGCHVRKVIFTARTKEKYAYEASNAKIYIGDNLCATLPSNVQKSKKYTFRCDVKGNFIKIVTGDLEDGFLSIGHVEVHGTSNEVQASEPP